ncbi:MAG: proline dehydrogenase family protein, partial [Thiolinea sp.]
GVHRDLLAYLVRRLLENGANASFVSQLLDNRIPPREVTADPVTQAQTWLQQPVPGVLPPEDLFQPERRNAAGFDYEEIHSIAELKLMREPFTQTQWQAMPLLADTVPDNHPHQPPETIYNPANGEVVGTVKHAHPEQIGPAVSAAQNAQSGWFESGVNKRAKILNCAADLYEQNAGEIFALLVREAGKTIADAIAELREAVDFLRYYAERCEGAAPVGLFTCISPWNFPLAIFTGQISAALACGNGVLAKPAEQTPLIAHVAVQILHEAGVPRTALQLLPGGGDVGAALTSDMRIN